MNEEQCRNRGRLWAFTYCSLCWLSSPVFSLSEQQRSESKATKISSRNFRFSCAIVNSKWVILRVCWKTKQHFIFVHNIFNISSYSGKGERYAAIHHGIRRPRTRSYWPRVALQLIKIVSRQIGPDFHKPLMQLFAGTLATIIESIRVVLSTTRRSERHLLGLSHIMDTPGTFGSGSWDYYIL
jgi:hypothetical protein